MANELAKFLNSRRRLKDDNAVERQVKIARQHGLTASDNVAQQPRRFVKHHALDCGRPGCHMCGNPRHIHKDSLTAQERRLFQDTEQIRDRHSNGLPPTDENT